MENYLCVDIGGTSIKYAKFNQEGKRVGDLKSCVTPITGGANQIMPALIRIVEQEKTNVAGVCVASAGVVDSVKGKIIYAGYTIPKYTGTEIKAELEHRFHIPCVVENDVNAACLGEFWLGGARGTWERALFDNWNRNRRSNVTKRQTNKWIVFYSM